MTTGAGGRLAIAQIGCADEGGGAAAVASGLMRGYARRGHRVWHVVGRKRGTDPQDVLLDDDDSPALRATGYAAAQRTLRAWAARHPDTGFGMASRALRLLTHPAALHAKWHGLEDFEFPASHRWLDRLDGDVNLVQAHNLHGGYFDLRALEGLSRRVPVVLTLHDMWLLTGHCAHSLGCERWRTGCGQCADLALEPAIRRDATDQNWRRKQAVYATAALRVAAPSRWLHDKIAASMLGAHVIESRVIPNGVDTTVFCPADRNRVREKLGWPTDAAIVLLTTGSLGSMWKDDRTLHRAAARLAARRPDVQFVSVGRDSAVPPGERVRATSIPYQHDPRVMAEYYQAADLYWHAARADTFPLAVLEAMACGTPVVATAVGGIPEQISELTGVLVPPGGWMEMADAADALLSDPDRRRQLAGQSMREIARCFTLDQQVDAYMSWFAEILGGAAARPPSAAVAGARS